MDVALFISLLQYIYIHIHVQEKHRDLSFPRRHDKRGQVRVLVAVKRCLVNDLTGKVRPSCWNYMNNIEAAVDVLAGGKQPCLATTSSRV